MNLCIDIGNSNTKLALFKGEELKDVFYTIEKFDEFLYRRRVKHVIISKTGANSFIEDTLNHRKIPFVLLSHKLNLPIKILYKTPHTLGADRIAGSVEAAALFPSENVLKIDFGTCITYDFVNADSEYMGGAISPGLMMRFKALNNFTAKLPLIDPMHYTDFELIGSDTVTSMLSGVMNGMIQELDGIINQYEQRFGGLKVVATGGDSLMFAARLKNEIFARPYLVLQGLNRILNDNI
jgi:type III pantothenate kinase